MSIIIMILLLSFLVLVHEAGHFLAARMFKIKVSKFGFGGRWRLYLSICPMFCAFLRNKCGNVTNLWHFICLFLAKVVDLPRISSQDTH